MTEEQTTKKKRTSPAVVIVQQKLPHDSKEAGVWFDLYRFGSPDSDNLRDAQKWISDEGEDGETYRIIRAWPAVGVEIEQTPRRVVKPV